MYGTFIGLNEKKLLRSLKPEKLDFFTELERDVWNSVGKFSVDV